MQDGLYPGLWGILVYGLSTYYGVGYTNKVFVTIAIRGRVGHVFGLYSYGVYTGLVRYCNGRIGALGTGHLV